MTEIEAARPDAVNPKTGEVLEHLEQQPPEALAEALSEIEALKAELKRWGGAIETELRRRLHVREVRFAQFGPYEVRLEGGRESVWDADGLEAVLNYLVDEGHVTAGDVADVITHPEPVVARAKANTLVKRLDGGARRAVEECVTWRDKPDKLTLTRSAELSLEAAEGALPAETLRMQQAPAEPPELPVTNLNHEELFK